MRIARITVVALLTLLLPAIPARAQKRGNEVNSQFTRGNPSFVSAFRPVISKINVSTVRIQCDAKDTALGCIVAADGWILTKASDLKEPISVKLKDGRDFAARWVGLHEPHDLALLKIETQDLTPIEWSDSKCAEVGNWVACVGQSEDPVAFGIVGVATRVLPPTAINPGYLGIQLEPVDGGVKITQVLNNTPATKAGLLANDVVLNLGGTDVPDPEVFMSVIQRFKPGDEVPLKIKRGDAELSIKATLGPRPANSRGDFQNALGSELSKRKTGFTSILQHDSVVKPNDCGGPLVDLEGRVVAVNICRKGRTESWAIPSEAIKPLLGDLMAGKLPPPKREVAPPPPMKVEPPKSDDAKKEKAANLSESDIREAAFTAPSIPFAVSQSNL